MTREQARESAKEDRRMAEIKEAYADGATIQMFNNYIWLDQPEPNFSEHTTRYQVKPKPVFRCWSKPEDVPVGRAVMRKKGSCVILAITESGVNWIGCGLESQVFYHNLASYEHAIIQPDGTLGPWLPCGKAEVA